MDWSIIIGIVVALLAAIGLPLALRKRKKGGPKKREELCYYLQEIGIRASLAKEGNDKEKIGLSRVSGQKSQGIIELKNRNIDSINVIGIASQYGVHYFLDYSVKSPNIIERRMLRKTRLLRKKRLPIWGKVATIKWAGDHALSQSLNFDYGLEDKLLQSNLKDLEGSIWIFPEPKYEYARIRTTYFLPSLEDLDAIDVIAKHVKSW